MDNQNMSRRPGRYDRPGSGAFNSPKPCRFFLQTGGCRYGDRCKFSHISPTNPQQSQSKSLGNHRQPAQNQDKLREWKRLLNQGNPDYGNPHTQLNLVVVSKFFGLGLELMEGDVAASQDVVKLLGGNTGLNFVKAMTDQHVTQATSDTAKIDLWQTQVSPCFRLVTHPRLVDSNVLEQEVACIYSFLVGVSATRVNKLSEFVLSVAEAGPRVSQVSFPTMEVLELFLSVLSKIIDCSTTTIVNDEFRRKVERLADLVNGSAQPQDDFTKLQATKYLNYLQRRLGVGKDIETFEPARATAIKREEFVLRKDGPGTLSANGPRHDNDHADISKIRIMPTYEEIMSPRGEYLPTTDSLQWHLPGIRGRLDREFRLLREDTIGQLRDAVQHMLERVRSPSKKESRQSRNNTRTSTYSHATVYDVTIDQYKGLELEVQCRQPETVCKMNEKTRREWWDQSKRLQAGALVCVLDAAGMIQFCIVAESTMRTEQDKNRAHKRNNQDEGPDQAHRKSRTLSSSSEYLYVKLNLVDKSPAELRRALRWSKDIGSSPQRHLVEFPGVLLASFKHTLEALQNLSQKPDLPFSDLIAPEKSAPDMEAQVSAPLFARAPGFEYDLSCLTQNAQNKFSISPDHPSTAGEISAKTGLDSTQSEALLSTLSRELSLIQGPPGTGKSYTGEKIIQVLLANRARAKLGPIICVCYTNHALDQLLEHLLDNGIGSIIRMGSRSKSERLQGLNLQAVAEDEDMTRTEKHENWQQGQTMRDLEQQSQGLLNQLASCDTSTSIQEYLRSFNKAHHDELFLRYERLDKEGFTRVGQKIKNPVQHWLRDASLSNEPTRTNVRELAALQSSRLWDMTFSERTRLFHHWLRSIRDVLINKVIDLHREHELAKEQRDRVRQEVRRRCLQQAHVIGVTTTGLARELSLLRKIRSKVVVCEEAGEVLEAHLLTSLLPSVEQAILIGDHLQLRPQIQNYDLQSSNPRGVQYSLDMSLFERLVQPPHATDLKLPFSSLETQRRMHPSIAEMVRSTLYNNLTDGEHVKSYPEVVGMSRRLFWLQHDQLEVGAAVADPSSTSHSNDFEVQMGAALVSHLIKQGHYNPEDIAVLTPYLGQLQKLRQRMAAEPTFAVNIDERDLEELEDLDGEKPEQLRPLKKQNIAKTTLLKSVRLATVDNFQGEEAKVIIISLVRSNPQNKCGFLSTSNRINVLLSRAKHGCYLIGNSNTCSNVPMWNQVIQLLKVDGNFGTSLELQCPRHPDTPIFASQPDHFATFSPDGGCILACDRRLECGHACYGRCHSDVLHKAIKCHEKCPRPKLGCDHACPRECGDACEERCNVVLRNIHLQLPCGHIVQSAKCWQAQTPAAIRCQEMIDRKIPGCDHTVKLACHIDISSPGFNCRAECRDILPCGHNCRSACYQCRVRKDGEIVETNHGICQQPCGRKYTTCPHTCSSVCHGEAKCAPCGQPCEVRCSHSRCSKPCHEPCAPCAEEECASHCPHTQCSMPCAAPCDWIPCSKRCASKLACGHQCPSLCGETCPDARYCQQCGSEDVLSAVVDYLLMGEYRDVDLDEDPCIFPDCGHFLTRSSMDGQMSMADHYELDGNDSPIAIKAPSAPFSMDGSTVKSCPQCRGSLRSVSRYGRIVRRAMLDESTKKFISWSGDRHLQLAERLLQDEQRLEHDGTDFSQNIGRPGKLNLSGRVPGQLSQLQKWVGKDRYKASLRIYMDILRYRDQVKTEEQPFQKVANFVKHAHRNKATANFSFDGSVIQLRGYLLATELLIRCNLSILSDFLRLWKGAAPIRTQITINFTANIEQCRELIRLAAETARPPLEAAGHVYYAQFCGLALALGDFPPPTPPQAGRGDGGDTVPDALLPEAEQPTAAAAAAATATATAEPSPTTPRETLKHKGQHHLAKAKALLLAGGGGHHGGPKQTILEAEIEAVEDLLASGGRAVFYKPVSAEELRAVYAAMASEFRGTGHWYLCERGHPFTVGECGMPMERARCPECGSAVGGQNHAPAEGVRHAHEMEELARGVGEMRM